MYLLFELKWNWLSLATCGYLWLYQECRKLELAVKYLNFVFQFLIYLCLNVRKIEKIIFTFIVITLKLNQGEMLFLP